MIVDTPGIGGGGKMSKYAERYLAKSYGFIYVINSANAGGVQKGRVSIHGSQEKYPDVLIV